MNKCHGLLLGLLLAVFATGHAFADTFSFAFLAADYSGSGTFYANPTANPARFVIYDVTGSVDTGFGQPKAIVGVLGPNAFESNDNLLFYPSRPSGAFFDASGVSFLLANGAEVNLFKLNGSYLMRAGGNTLSEVTAIGVLQTSAPEPSSFVLLGTGLVGGLAMLRRRSLRILVAPRFRLLNRAKTVAG